MILTPGVRRTATALLIALALLGGFLYVLRQNEKARTEELTRALIAYASSGLDALVAYEDVIQHFPKECAAAEREGRKRLAAGIGPHEAKLRAVLELGRAANESQNAAASLALRQALGARLEAVRNEQPYMVDALRDFKQTCPKESAALDQLLGPYVRSVEEARSKL